MLCFPLADGLAQLLDEHVDLVSRHADGARNREVRRGKVVRMRAVRLERVVADGFAARTRHDSGVAVVVVVVGRHG